MFTLLGWPKVAILTLSREKILLAVITLVSCYLCPLVISCVIYVIIICQKERHFKNNISVASEMEMKASNGQNKSNNPEGEKSEESSNAVVVNVDCRQEEKIEEKHFDEPSPRGDIFEALKLSKSEEIF